MPPPTPTPHPSVDYNFEWNAKVSNLVIIGIKQFKSCPISDHRAQVYLFTPNAQYLYLASRMPFS